MKNPSRTYEEQGICVFISLDCGKENQAGPYVPDLKPKTESTRGRGHDWLTPEPVSYGEGDVGCVNTGEHPQKTHNWSLCLMWASSPEK